MTGSGFAGSLVEDWNGGRQIDTRGRNKIAVATGMMSRTGEALDRFGGFLRYLTSTLGYASGDFLEISYNSVAEGDGWRPAPYESAHCDLSLADVTSQVGRSLRWYRDRLPDDTRYHTVGYSLGGVALFDATSALLFGEPERWQGRLASLVTLSAPLYGTDLGPEGDLLDSLGFGALLPQGEGIRELLERGRSREHRARIDRQATRLRSLGVQLLTLADAEDVVVTPEDAIVAPPGERNRFVLSGPRVPAWAGGGGAGVPLGHGPLLWNTLAWVRMGKLIGPQEPRT
ncbi:MAG: hypothetical protein IT305_11105 [Chloroflexi bacterium]|nr:hypothetical protein [Chloroflexota bacterium]